MELLLIYFFICFAFVIFNTVKGTLSVQLKQKLNTEHIRLFYGKQEK